MTEDPVDTGFDSVIAGEVWTQPDVQLAVSPEAIDEVTATVTEPAGLTPAGVQAAKALVRLPTTLDYPALAKLAREIAMDIKERHIILKEVGLNDTQYDFLEANNEFYKQALKAACIEWHAPLSTADRIKVAAQAILEDSLPTLGARMQNKGEGLPGVVEAAKFFGKIADVGERGSGPSSPGERFSINIDLGGDKSLGVVVETKAHPAPAQPALLAHPKDGGVS